jgi:hypothetical protein
MSIAGYQLRTKAMKIDLDLAIDAVKRASEQVDLLLYADLVDKI